MKIYQKLKELFVALEPHRGSWIVCGGVAASIYRDLPRFTGDIDIAVTDQSAGTALHVAESVLKQLGYQPVAGFIPGKKEQALVVGRESGAELFLGVDFLLPSNPWVDDAVRRGQSNLLDYGFVSAPTITVEDLYLAKVLAHQENKDRVLDRDDVESIFRAGHTLDLDYVRAGAAKLKIILPTGFKGDPIL